MDEENLKYRAALPEAAASESQSACIAHADTGEPTALDREPRQGWRSTGAAVVRSTESGRWQAGQVGVASAQTSRYSPMHTRQKACPQPATTGCAWHNIAASGGDLVVKCSQLVCCIKTSCELNCLQGQ